MKAKNLFFGALTCLAFAACSNDDEPIVNGGAQAEGDQYVVVNIATPTATRAAEDYLDGSEIENKITKGLFVFFDAAGNYSTATEVNSFASMDQTDGNPYVEAKLATAVLVLDEPKSTPASVIAILNSSLTATDVENKDLATVRNLVVDCAACTEGAFVMSNSVWKDNYSTPITSEHLNVKETPDADYPGNKDENPSQTEIEKAKAVDIYVERVLARVDVAQKDGFVIQATKAGETAGIITAQNELVYRTKNTTTGAWEYKVLTLSTALKNVHLSYTTPVSYILKEIPATADTEWDYVTESWDDPNNYRSYWAKSVSTFEDYKGVDSYNWGHVNYSGGVTVPATATMYCQENTSYLTPNSDYEAANTATKLVITAQHSITANTGESTKTGTLNLYKYKAQYYLEDGIMAEISLILNNYYYSYVEGEETKYSNDWSKKVTLGREKNAAEAWVAVPSVATLDKIYSDNKGTEITVFGGSTDATDFIQDILNEMTEIWCWEDGRCYYYLDIDHINGKPAIIRNHVYKLTLSSIIGLGTPVFDPNDGNGDDDDDDPEDEDPIIPTKPEDDAFFVTAQLNVLKWRIVNQDVTLDW